MSSVQFEDEEAGNLILTDRTRTQYEFYTQDGGVTWISLPGASQADCVGC